LISCKYLSRIVISASPWHLFEQLLQGRHGRRSADWYLETAAPEYEALYGAVRSAIDLPGLPDSLANLSADDRKLLSQKLTAGWPGNTADNYRDPIDAVPQASAERWKQALETSPDQEAMLWRLLRLGSAPTSCWVERPDVFG
jgi:hypothetical protein